MKKAVAFLVVLSLVVVGAALAADKGLSMGDKSFLKDAASGGMMEVQLGQVAQGKAGSQDVKNFASRMVTDHGKAGEELKTFAATKNAALPDKLEHKHKTTIEKLSKLSGSEFDKKYMEAMVKDHEKDVADFKKAVKKVKDPELNAWVVKTLPVLEQHLQMAKETAQKVGAKVK